MSYREENYENAIIQLMEKLGYEYVYGPDIERDYSNPLYEEELRISLSEINPNLPNEAIEEAIFKIHNFNNQKLEINNSVFTDYLQNGIDVGYRLSGEQKYDRVILVDYKNIEKNSFIIANQWTIVEHSEKRADLVIFLNGIPLVVVELKSPSREETDVSAAYRQLRNYMQEIPSLFVYNAFCVMSDMAETKAGTITAGEDRFMAWKTTDGSYESTKFADYNTFFNGIFEKRRFLDILKNFICFSIERHGYVKILAAYHQYYAVNKAIESTIKASTSDGKAGVFWHTQGSGKSLSMVFYTDLLQQNLNSPTVVVITDRNDLDDQLFGQFLHCKDFLRQTPQQAESRENLRSLLEGREANGIIFTTMQKFTETDEPLSLRRNIIVMADEAHRGHYEIERIDPKTGTVKISMEILIRRSLPNATYIGFTGTPISQRDRNTREVFGDYIDVYDMTQAVEDGATRPVYYESRVVHLKLDKSIMEKIDQEYDKMAEIAESYSIEKSKQELSKMESLLGAEQTIDALCNDIIRHYEENRETLLTGKAMIVAYSREIAMKIYKKILSIKPNWKEKIAVVMTSANNDPEEWKSIIGNKSYKEELASKFKNNDSPLKIAIVVDMWLTGFDVPSLATMYVYKPMEGHNLMQAIARVNRVFKDKEGGLIVDYVGIASALKQAMNDYTSRDKQKYGDMEIGITALPRFIEKLIVCRELFYGFDYSYFKTATDYDRAQLIMDGVNFLSDPQEPERKEHYLKEAMLLKQALSLCRSVVKPDDRFEAAFFESVRTLLTRISSKPHYISLREINTRINELLRQSIKSEGVVNLFSDVKEEFSIFDPKFLAEVAKLKQKNIAVELLKKLIAEQVSVYQKTNVVKSQKFSELLQKTMNAYLNGLISNEEVIQELLRMAKEIVLTRQNGNSMGLSLEETAFYDALTKPQAVKDVYTNDELVAITKELTEALRKNKTIDWQRKETARARMRILVKRLLKKHKYPPEGQDEALDTVIAQCEMWTDNANDNNNSESIEV
jgi:type I site-specific deoxyribonuclease, hsdR family